MPVKHTGVAQVRRHIQAIARKSPDVIAAAMYVVVEMRVTTRAKQIVPYEFGVLSGSIYTTLPERNGRSITVTIEAGGGPSEDYAVVQHENLRFKHAPGRSAKFIEIPFREIAGTWLSLVTEQIVARMGNMV